MVAPEKIAARLAVLLLKYSTDEETLEQVNSMALDMARRASRALSDPSWWELVGRPYFNKQMQWIREQRGKAW